MTIAKESGVFRRGGSDVRRASSVCAGRPPSLFSPCVSLLGGGVVAADAGAAGQVLEHVGRDIPFHACVRHCLLYTSDAADE